MGKVYVKNPPGNAIYLQRLFVSKTALVLIILFNIKQ